MPAVLHLAAILWMATCCTAQPFHWELTPWCTKFEGNYVYGSTISNNNHFDYTTIYRRLTPWDQMLFYDPSSETQWTRVQYRSTELDEEGEFVLKFSLLNDKNSLAYFRPLQLSQRLNQGLVLFGLQDAHSKQESPVDDSKVTHRDAANSNHALFWVGKMFYFQAMKLEDPKLPKLASQGMDEGDVDGDVLKYVSKDEDTVMQAPDSKDYRKQNKCPKGTYFHEKLEQERVGKSKSKAPKVKGFKSVDRSEYARKSRTQTYMNEPKMKQAKAMTAMDDWLGDRKKPYMKGFIRGYMAAMKRWKERKGN